MNERLDLTALRDGVDLPPTQVAEGAWERGRRRVRRRRAAGAVGVAALVVAVAVVPTLVGPSGDGSLQPAGTLAQTDVVVVDVPLDAGLVDDDLITDLDRVVEEATVLEPGTVALADEPVDRALLAVQVGRGVSVLAADGDYRSVEAPGAGLQPSSLNPTGERLVLTEPDAVVVTDLATATTSRVELPAVGMVGVDVVLGGWADETSLLVGDGGRSWLVDVTTGSVTESALPGETTFGPSGPVQWVDDVVATEERRLDVGIGVLGGYGPVAGETWVASSAVVAAHLARGGPTPGTAAERRRDGLAFGVAVVDVRTGEPRSFLPASYEGGADPSRDGGLDLVDPIAREDDVVLLSADYRGTPVVLRWDWRAGTVTGVVRLLTPRPATAFSWGAGWDEASGTMTP